MKRTASFPLLAGVVVAPLLALAVVAWLGNRAQVQGAWAAAKEDADRFATDAAANTSRALEQSVTVAAIYPDPPLPGDGGPFPDTDDLEELRRLRDAAGPALTDSGLPVKVIAALRLFGKTESLEDGRIAAARALGEPSVITGRALSEISKIQPDAVDSAAMNQWTKDEAARFAARSIEPESVGHYLDFTPDEAPIVWIRVVGDEIHYVHRQNLETAAKSRGNPGAYRSIPWAVVELIVNDRQVINFLNPVESSGGKAQEVMAEKPVPFDGRLRIRVSAAKPELILSAARRQSQWITALLLCAVASSAGGLFLISRAFSRERRLNALKSDFVASVSHELRAPIASIRLMADALEQGKINGETAKEFHRLISKEGARLSTLIENVLDFARIEQNRKEWRFGESDLTGLVRETVSLMQPLAAEKDITLRTNVPAEELSMRADAGALQQALVNLIDNAIKFSPAASTITVTLSAGEAGCRICISDNGPGIPKSEHLRIFEKFHRLGGELRRETQGTGIGLSLVKAIAEAHQGRVTLESAPGNGSTFILHLPSTHP
ncbi:HAMP domain-containing sensor histidine kinase [Luteolibacter sp. SL250]|uniref:sensor histidine kinase n=1 Tax=Luteolibacter sp. SL250 TaxID=2995170 RepID=UPI00226FE146|nr:HAMP domain-containing sensor histidine kinase [Luteolibacter sp. SL250]WAC20427.1 HAMP domain-containing sensor histidine kinase [Luteolibacter sp. SL250]